MLVRGAIVVAVDMDAAVTSKKDAQRFRVEEVRQGTGSASVNLELRHPRMGPCDLLVRRASTDGTYFLLSDCAGSLWSKIIARWADRKYPTLARVSLRTDEMEQLLRALRKATGVGEGAFRITEFTYRARLNDSHARRQEESDRRWTDLALEEAFDLLHEADAALERVRFECWSPGCPVRRGALSRRLDFSFTGDFALCRRVFLEPAAEIAGARNTQLSGRQREIGSQFEARPFFIEYASDIVGSQEARQKLVDSVARMANTGHSVIHGNPYVHISLVDYLEETNCDIYVLSPNRITIVPQTSSTATALERLYAHICRTFAEGRIVDYSEADFDG